jgi:hypothetical protein
MLLALRENGFDAREPIDNDVLVALVALDVIANLPRERAQRVLHRTECGAPR